MVINSKILSIIIPLILVLGIGGSMMAGLWNSGDKIPSRYEENELNPYDPQSISGSYSFSQVSEFFEVPIDVLYTAFGISESFDPNLFKAKNLGTIYEASEVEIGTEALQAFVALYKDLPYALVDVYLPTTAVELILKLSTLSEEEKTYLASHTLNVIVLDPSKVSLTEEEENTTEFGVKGPTTIQEVLDAGLSKAAFEAIVKTSVTFTNQTVKDFCIAKGLSFSEIKVALEEAINK